MRPIKFRAWYRGHMHEVTQLRWSAAHADKLDKIEMYRDGRTTTEYGEDACAAIGDLMQFTGLLDRNGREVYEGDIVKIEDATAKVVFWERPPEFGLDTSHNGWCEDWNLTDHSERIEVIGNIYENPELVGGARG